MYRNHRLNHQLFRLCILVLVAGLLLSGCSTQSQKPVEKKPLKPSQEAVRKEVPITQTITLYFADKQAEHLVSELRKVTVSKEALPATVVKELIRGPRTSGAKETLPNGTRLLSIAVKNKVAQVNFSREIRTQHPGGSAAERLTVYSIVNSLAKVSGINKVQLLIEGMKVTTLAGHVDISQPLAPDFSLVKAPVEVQKPQAQPQPAPQPAKVPKQPQPAPQPAKVPQQPQPAPQPAKVPQQPQPAPQPAKVPQQPQPAPQPQPQQPAEIPKPQPQPIPEPGEAPTPQPAPQPQEAPPPTPEPGETPAPQPQPGATPEPAEASESRP